MDGRQGPPAGLVIRPLCEADLAAAAAVSASAPDAWSEEALRAGLRCQQAGGAVRLFGAVLGGGAEGRAPQAPGTPDAGGCPTPPAGPDTDSFPAPPAGPNADSFPAPPAEPGSDPLAGFAAFQLAGGEASLDTLAVAPALRRRGVGRCLLRAALEALAAQGAGCCFLEVRLSNAPAIALYQSLGFAAVGRRPGFYRAPAEDALIMRCPLPCVAVQ